jgi:hypothetical protein
MKFSHYRSWIFAGLTLFLLGACNTQPDVTKDPLPTDLPSVPTEEPPIPIDEPAQRVFGPGTFSLDLPEGWDIFGPIEVTNDPDRPYEAYHLGEDPTSSGGPGVSIVAIDRTAKWTPEDFVLSQCSTCPQNPFESVTLDGIPALRTEIGGGGVPIMITWYFVEHRGNFIAFALHDPETLEPLEETIETIQFE